MVKLAILGTCVTRDAVSDPNIKVERYLARSSFTAMLAPPSDLSEFRPPSSKSAFMDKCLEADFAKTHLQAVREAQPDFVIVDPIDERCGHFVRGKEIVTYSETIMYRLKDLAQQLKAAGFAYQPRDDAAHARSLPHFDELLARLTEIVPASRVIFHDARYMECYRSKSGQIERFQGVEKIATANRRLMEYADVARSRLGAQNVIGLGDAFVAHEGHQWGLAPYHYEPAYNEAFREKLAAVTRRD